MINKNQIRLAGLLLVMVGAGWTLYEMFSGGGASITRSRGFIIFIVGFLIVTLSNRMTGKN